MLIWRRLRWFTRILALGPLLKALALCWRQGLRLGRGEVTPAFDWLFALAAIVATVLMLRASWGTRPRDPAASPVGEI